MIIATYEPTMIKPAINAIGRAVAGSTMLLLLFTATSAIAEPLALDVIEAAVAYDAGNGTPLVSFRLSEGSQRAFANFSSVNVGKKIDIRVGGKTVMQTVIREPITGGVGQIIATSPDEAHRLANRLINKTSLEVETSP